METNKLRAVLCAKTNPQTPQHPKPKSSQPEGRKRPEMGTVGKQLSGTAAMGHSGSVCSGFA
jgi:hypothetical protein